MGKSKKKKLTKKMLPRRLQRLMEYIRSRHVKKRMSHPNYPNDFWMIWKITWDDRTYIPTNKPMIKVYIWINEKNKRGVGQDILKFNTRLANMYSVDVNYTYDVAKYYNLEVVN